MKGLWWKILAILLLFYALFFGTLVPLKPGITHVSQTTFNAGQHHKLEVSTYNYDESKGASGKAFLKLKNGTSIQAKSIQAKENVLDINFSLPVSNSKHGDYETATLIVTDEYNGTIVFPDGFVIKKSLESTVSGDLWSSDKIHLFKKSGFLFPYRNILLETIRNTFYHVTLWFAMFILFFASTITAILFLRKKNIDFDHMTYSLISAGIVFGILGLLTGAIWAKDTWGTYWTNDVKLNMAAISMMIYLAYWILRMSIDDVDRKAKVSAAYAIFAFCTIIPLIFVVPRITSSLHPGNGGNPALGGEDLDNKLRMIFYPAIIGFTLLGVWIAQIILRFKRLQDKVFQNL